MCESTGARDYFVQNLPGLKITAQGGVGTAAGTRILQTITRARFGGLGFSIFIGSEATAVDAKPDNCLPRPQPMIFT
jgi:hypothetical protein